MIVLEDLLYTEEHIWVKPDGNQEKAVVGITDFGQEEFGTLVSVDLPEAGDEFVETDCFATVENSMGQVSELLCPLTGKVLLVNDQLIDAPNMINEDPYDDGWIIVLKLAQPQELDDLMTPEEYEKYVDELKIKEDEELEDEDDALEVVEE